MSQPRLRHVSLGLASLVTMVAAEIAVADQPPSAPAKVAPIRLDLLVHVTGFKHSRGHAMAKLFVPGDRLTGPGHATARADIHGSVATFTFRSLRPGPYAVIVFHDENDNGVLDHGLFGPKEPLGFSNGFRRRPLSLPSFDKLKFVLGPSRKRIEVTVR